MEIITDKAFLENAWPIVSFCNTYGSKSERDTCRCAVIAKSGEAGDPDETALIFLRLFIENGERAKKDQKYIIGLRFYSFGDMASVDIVSLDKGYHRDIVHEHATRMDWLFPEAPKVDAFLESYSIPMVAAGAYLQVTADNIVTFSGQSSDFSGKLFGWDVNEIARQAAFICGTSTESSNVGKEFLQELVDFLLENKLKKDFYEKFVENFIAGRFTGQNFGGLLTMKVLDRALKEKKDILQLLVEEVTDGFAKKSMIISVAQKMKEKK